MKKDSKIYTEEENRYRFASNSFLAMINERKNTQKQINAKATKQDVMNDLASKACVSIDAIKNWMYGYNGPSDIEQIKLLGDFFHVNYHRLLEKVEDTMSERTVDRKTVDYAATKDVFRKLYKMMLGYIDELKSIDNSFTKSGFELAAAGDDVNEDRKRLISSLRRIDYFMTESLLDIPEDLYDKIKDYLWGGLCEMINVVAPTSEFLEEYKVADRNRQDEIEKGFNEKIEDFYAYTQAGFEVDARMMFEDYIAQ